MKFRFSFHIGTSGFGFIELMMVAGLTSIVLFGMAQIILSNANAHKSLELTNGLNMTITELQMVLKNPVACSANIANFSPNPFDPTAQLVAVQKISSLTKDIITNNGPLPNAPGTSVTITLENFNNISATNYTADLTLTLDRGINAVGGRIIKRRLPIDLVSSGSPPTVTISGCSSTPTSGGALSQNDVCALFGGTYDPIQAKCVGTGGGGTSCPAMPMACGNGVTYTYHLRGPAPIITQDR